MKIGLIVFIIYIVFQVITIIVQHRAKQQEERRRREALERRRQVALSTAPPAHMAGMAAGAQAGPGGVMAGGMAGGMGGRMGGANVGGFGAGPFPGAAPAPVPAPMPGPLRAGAPVDDLANRRKAQLEQLRARRESRRVGLPVESAPSRQLPLEPRPTPPSPRPPATVAADLAAAQARQRIEQARRQQQTVTGAGAVETSPKARKSSGARPQQQQARSAAGEPVEAIARTGETTAAKVQAGRRRHAILAALGDRSRLAELFVLKEMLDPPVSVRERPENPA